ncbi:MAG TPA: hypothetical protein VGG89_02540 [Candidatus Baltobacteraceae bacterium]|jgi:uncharacterized FlaG/YvyC family protein
MDVSTTGQAVAAVVPQANVETVTGTVGTSSTNVHLDGVVTNASANQSHDSTQSGKSALAPAIAKLFALPGPRAPISLNVSYRIEGDSDTIVTVFSDPKTGQEVAQFPPDVLAQVASFFDQHRGATLDKSA